MPHLHMKGVDVVVDLLDAAEDIDRLSEQELKTLLLEAADVLGDLLKRDVPADVANQDLCPGS
ncbi:MAG: hypothetical protein EOS58_18345 [Mesorhizobium sp.]|nr:MAG: hypothetical protein EOS58_18345 [Mesorhizobium sp.]